MDARSDAGVRLALVHRTPERARFRFQGRVPPPEALGALADRLAALPGVRRIEIRPATGSLIVEMDARAGGLGGADGPAGLAARIAAEGIARIGPAPQPPPIGEILRVAALAADQKVRARTGGALDLAAAVALGLGAVAVVQAVRGQAFGPASALVLGAAALLDRRGR